MVLQGGRDAIVVDQRVVDVEKKDYLVLRHRPCVQRGRFAGARLRADGLDADGSCAPAAAAGRLSDCSQRRKPPRNALALLPRRAPGGSSSSILALPPPMTT